jgi:hypothetical protein
MTSLAETSKHGDAASQDASAKMAEQHLSGLGSGAMKLGGDLAEQLKNLDADSLKSMSPEQMKNLQERLKQNAQALRETLANAPQFDFKEVACKMPGEGEGEGEGKGEREGQGGPRRGKGDAQMTLKKDESQLGTKATETASLLLDPERIAPGDLMGMTDGKPQVDESAFRGTAAGGTAGTGRGGAAVRQNELTPAERATLQRYFK